MPKQKLTPWFPAHVMPVHAGVYERDTKGSNYKYWYFNGSIWIMGGYAKPNTAARMADDLPSKVRYRWRGLISPIPTNQPQKEIEL